ncbi:hypothetical protein [Streptomyces sp. NK08204]|uniref:hypothetical protein n=1 Tax=Streptomyces sp. NK08204 TaxID=2873260 RepID=UPI0027E388BB|nr:hypothetical protein [Streptomyces sp. NK08204]
MLMELEYHRMRSAELLREAEQERLARAVVRLRRDGRHENAARKAPAGGTHTSRPRRRQPVHTA